MKRALNSITETGAVTWAPDRIRVNGITSGGTATEMMEEWEALSLGIIAASTSATPLGRMAEPPEVAEFAAWLLGSSLVPASRSRHRARRRRRRR